MGATQTTFDFGAVDREPRSVQQCLEELLAPSFGRIAVAWTNNARVMVSARRRGAVTVVRLHHMFLDADQETLRAVARFLLGTEGIASGQLREFIAHRRERIERVARRPA